MRVRRIGHERAEAPELRERLIRIDAIDRRQEPLEERPPGLQRRGAAPELPKDAGDAGQAELGPALDRSGVYVWRLSY
jgi:hypothetical protein